LPKAIVHTHAGILAEFHKMGAFHLDLRPESVMFFYSTTGWMMWNSLAIAPLLGATAVLYDGSPLHPSPGILWEVAEHTGTTIMGASPSFVEALRAADYVPGEHHRLDALDTVLLAGSAATPEMFLWFYEAVKQNLWVTSQSGGTEFCSGLAVAVPTLPVRAGEIQARALGVDLAVLDAAGCPIEEAVGELVVRQPMPSMPLRLWGDEGYERYRRAYFEHFPGVWRHGDFARITGQGGCYIYGRSDATLNRHGVRIGSSEIYRTILGIEAIADALVVCVEEPGGGFYMPLFVELRAGERLDAALVELIRGRLRSERSPRHVPDAIIAAPVIPYTLTGKRMEVPVRELLLGRDSASVASRGSMRDPTALDFYADFARRRSEAGGSRPNIIERGSSDS
jgi:acetoacetyl-CoA synthetase